MEAHMTTAARVTRALLAASCGLLLLAAAASADTYVVDADGTGDFPTIQDAIDAASDNDVVELLDGTYTGDGNRDIDFHGKAITVRSQSGDPLSCVIDCEGTALEPHRGFHFHTLETSASVVRGVTVTNGRIHHTGDLDGGGAVICYTASPRFENCVLTGNSVTADPGGMFIRGGGVALYGLSTPAFVDCTISDNSTSGGQSYGSGIFAYLSAEVTLENCVIEGNGGATFGGGLYGYYSSVYATDCTFSGNGAVNGAGVFLGTPETAYSFVGCKFAGNHANNGGGAYCVHTASFDNCTFAMNEGTIYAGGVYCGGSIVDVSLENTVVAFSTSGEGVYAESGLELPEVECCDVFGNDGGEYGGGLSDLTGVDGNFSEDPLFCDVYSGDLQLCSNSPCLPGGNGCGVLIGAEDTGCGDCDSPVQGTSWGAVKAMFR